MRRLRCEIGSVHQQTLAQVLRSQRSRKPRQLLCSSSFHGSLLAKRNPRINKKELSDSLIGATTCDFQPAKSTTGRLRQGRSEEHMFPKNFIWSCTVLYITAQASLPALSSAWLFFFYFFQLKSDLWAGPQKFLCNSFRMSLEEGQHRWFGKVLAAQNISVTASDSREVCNKINLGFNLFFFVCISVANVSVPWDKSLSNGEEILTHYFISWPTNTNPTLQVNPS